MNLLNLIPAYRRARSNNARLVIELTRKRKECDQLRREFTNAVNDKAETVKRARADIDSLKLANDNLTIELKHARDLNAGPTDLTAIVRKVEPTKYKQGYTKYRVKLVDSKGRTRFITSGRNLTQAEAVRLAGLVGCDVRVE